MGAFAPSVLVTDALRRSDRARGRAAGAVGDGRGRHAVPRLPLLRADADRRRPEGDRVQLPLRRSRGAGRAAAARPSRLSALLLAASTGRPLPAAADVLGRGRRRRRAGVGGLSGRLDARPRHHWPRSRGRGVPGRPRALRGGRRARRRPGHRRRPRAHRGRPWRRPIARPSTPPTTRPASSRSTACSIAPTSGAGPSAVRP